ncbi:hypothetical protein [Paludisphaera borealis]|uniref:hypothetical protein n=1 Tax=Paludisphaera borealis TaxID=1387353 RepID=UPI002852B415|nr:hypothetical protein [Paludisphaera borealis]
MRLLKSRRWKVVYAAAFAVIAVFATGVFNDAVWSGQATIPLEFVVLGASTGRPIEGAVIRQMDETGSKYEAVAGPDGRVKIAIQARIAGRSSLLRRTRSVNYQWLLDVTADRHERLNEDLGRLTRDPAYHYGPVPPPIVIRLAPRLWIGDCSRLDPNSARYAAKRPRRSLLFVEARKDGSSVGG